MCPCTAELVLGRDHTAAETEEFVRAASQGADGIKVISLTDIPGGHPALPPEDSVSYVQAHHLTPITHPQATQRTFLMLLMACGPDAAIVDPCDQQLMMNIIAAEALLGHDYHCRNYLRAYREGKFAQVT